MSESLVKWLAFRIFLGLLPIGFNAVRLALDGNEEITIITLLSRGELVLMACAISSGAIGDLLVAPKEYTELSLMCAGGCIAVLSIGAFLYATISGDSASMETYNAAGAAKSSIILYIIALIAAASCIAVAEFSKTKSMGRRP